MLNNPQPAGDCCSSPWTSCLDKIQHKIGPSSFETWFRTIEFSIDGDAVSLMVPNKFFADFIEEHFSEKILESLHESGISCSSVSFLPLEKEWNVVEPVQVPTLEKPVSPPPPRHVDRSQFHPNYTFDTFVIGDNNRMAHAACLAVAEAPGKTTFNPLVIYGGTGLGKTHLLQALGHFAHTEATAENVFYMTSKEFISEYISYVVDRKDSTSFYKKFKDVDLLLLDDIQFFGRKPGTQKEFFRIFNRIMLENKQIVLTSDRPPDKIPDMMHHIINRFMGGLITDIQPPALETRMAILHRKAETDGLNLPDDVIQYLAGHITSNVRELEGTLTRLIASSTFTGRDITLDIAREICGDMILRKEERLSVSFIKEKVAETFDISVHQLSAHTRKRNVTRPRNIAMYLCKKWTKQSLRTIGLEFGGRDYSTVIHAAKKIENDIETDNEMKEKVTQVERLLQPLTS